ncbi:hypothetical protein TRFO_35938 [Tritrichomonas foetus]|uniref:MRH domain-containing protein n=1 Tax=Tritrichomonas foetus TaxID=1144522 RepID=A0A1J4JKJ6_9EUKA|nr:hypothetical protein TRFO_35938 [Tritrichomonas foetus]|eukprot:OHS97764.1 hypothetical protein TRFO_35938 [Tritrichomonas foetus]
MTIYKAVTSKMVLFLFFICELKILANQRTVRFGSSSWNLTRIFNQQTVDHFIIEDNDYYFLFHQILPQRLFSFYSNVPKSSPAVLCHNSTKICHQILSKSYDCFAKPIDGDKGIAFTMKEISTSRKDAGLIYEIEHEFLCDPKSNFSRIEFKKKIVHKKEINHIKIFHHSNLGCPAKYLKSNELSKKSGKDLHFVFTQGDYQIDINLSSLNSKTGLPRYSKVVSYNKIHSHILYFQPTIEMTNPKNYIEDYDTNQYQNNQILQMNKHNSNNHRKLVRHHRFNHQNIDKKISDDVLTDNYHNCEGNGENETGIAWVYNTVENSCSSFGKITKNLTAYLNKISIMNGIVVHYGDTLTVHYECDESLKDDELRMPSGIILSTNNNNTVNSLKFSVASKSACAKGLGPTPSPPPIVRIPTPAKATTPTPTPIPSPNSRFFVRNSTHYTLFDLKQLKQETYRGDLQILINGEIGQFYTEYSPWSSLECPNSWECPEFEQSNLWGCWYQEDMTKYCHSIGDKHISTRLIPLAPNNLSRGVSLRYGGAYGISGELRIACDEENAPEAFSFHESSATFHRSLSGPEISYNLTSSLVCPKKFTIPPHPTPMPEPTPSFDPDKDVNLVFKSKIMNKTRIILDLSGLQQTEQFTVLAHNQSFELDFILFNAEKQVNCPTDYECIDQSQATNQSSHTSSKFSSDASSFYASSSNKYHNVTMSSKDVNSNVWKCLQDGKCFSIGDSRYDLMFELINEDDLNDGVSVTYGGGYAGHSFRILMKCDSTKTGKLLEFSELNFQNDPKIVTVNVETSFVCPTPVDILDFTFSGGSAFILVVSVLIVFYLTVGVLVTLIKTGVIEFPNKEFWREFIECVKTASNFIFLCGKSEKEHEDNQKYNVLE